MPRSSWPLLALALGLAACAANHPPPTQEAPAWTTTSLTAGHEARAAKAILAPGYAAVTWAEQEGAQTRLYLAERGDAWGPPELVAGGGSDPVRSFDLAGNGKGEAVLAWREGQHVRVRLRRGGAWQGAVELAAADPMWIAAAMDEEGTAWVAWRVKVGSEYHVMVARDEGAGFQADDVAPGHAPDLAAASCEALLVFEGSAEIGYAEYRGGWQAPGSFRVGMANQDPQAHLGPDRAFILWHWSGLSGNGLARAERAGGS